jgi:hypothetical protein
MDLAELAALEHANMIEADVLAASQVPGALVRRAGGIALFTTSLPLRLFNQVVIESADADPEGIVSAVAVMRERGARFVVNLRRGTDDRYVAAATSLGLVPLADGPWMPGMAMHPMPAAGSVPPRAGLDIRRVVDGAGIADHIRAAAGGFAMPPAWIEAIVTEPLARHPDVAMYVGYVDGEPVTSGLGIRTGQTIGVYNIATVEAARGRGYGAAMTMRIVDDGGVAGCTVAALQASEMGLPIYERLGFRTIVEYVGWVDPDAPAAR